MDNGFGTVLVQDKEEDYDEVHDMGNLVQSVLAEGNADAHAEVKLLFYDDEHWVMDPYHRVVD